MEAIKLAIIGLALGISLVIPGISAGTMAVVFNVYDRLIRIITPNVKKILAEWKFWLPLVIGIGIGVFLFSKAVVFMFNNHPFPTWWFFIGLIAGSIPLIYKRIRDETSKLPPLSSIISAVIALAIMAALAVFRPEETTEVYKNLTPSLFGMMFAAGAFSAIAMLIPGISGSFFMLVIGLYLTVMNAISSLNILLLTPLALGIIAGLLAGAALIRSLLAKVPKQTYGAAIGLLAGSLIFLYTENLYPSLFGEGLVIIVSIMALLGGAAISFFFGRGKD